VHPKKTRFSKESVDGRAQAVAQASHGTECLRAWPQMRDLPQELEAMWFRLDWVSIGIIDPPEHAERLHGNLDRLPLALRLDKLAFGLNRATGAQVQNLRLVVVEGARNNELQGIVRGAVRHLHEGKTCFRVASRADPTPNRNRLTYV
jgi:hypothetical protein